MSEQITDAVYTLDGLRDPLRLCGRFDENLTLLENLLSIKVRLDGEALLLHGKNGSIAHAKRALDRLLHAAVTGSQIGTDDVKLAVADAGSQASPQHAPKTILTTPRGREIRPKTSGQRAFVASIEAHSLTFGIGPAGTGKTFLAAAMAVRALKNHEISRIVLTRPAVEAGEHLGFLPGDAREKIDPYLRPLYDALSELLDDGAVLKYLERGTIEVAPLAFMRGRTLSDAFVILDEAQNATREQLKMFLTRLGEGSKMVVSGDVTQIDLPRGAHSGLREVTQLFGAIPEIGIVTLDSVDVVRHPLVIKIVDAYRRSG